MTTETTAAPNPQPSLPQTVAHHITRLRGRIETIEPLGGLSGSRVLRVRTTNGNVVAKGGTKAAEIEFYEEISPLLAPRGVGVPDLLWAGTVTGERWLVIEEIPTPLSRERWGADSEVIAVLRRIHRDEGEPLPPLRATDAFHPAWTGATNAAALAALTALPPDEIAALGATLAGLRAAAAPLFTPDCPLSGDPNPANWGLRANGALVLFDWERFCRGTPALDLAVIIPGLGTAADYSRTAAAYLALAPGGAGHPAPDVARLAGEIAIAKAWTAVELLAGIGQGVVPGGPTADWLRAHAPGWLQTVMLAG